MSKEICLYLFKLQIWNTEPTPSNSSPLISEYRVCGNVVLSLQLLNWRIKKSRLTVARDDRCIKPAETACVSYGFCFITYEHYNLQVVLSPQIDSHSQVALTVRTV